MSTVHVASKFHPTKPGLSSTLSDDMQWSSLYSFPVPLPDDFTLEELDDVFLSSFTGGAHEHEDY